MTAPTLTRTAFDPPLRAPHDATEPAAPWVTVLYEHPDWFKPLFAELERRGVPFRALHAAQLAWDPAARPEQTGVVINRMSPSAWTRGQSGSIFHTLHYLEHLDGLGVPVINGVDAFRVELSKARQLSLLAELGIRHPKSRVIAHASQAVPAAEDLTYPVVVKPNIGGSGAGIRSFADADELGAAAGEGGLTFGIDGVAIVQEQLAAVGEQIVRIEILGDRYLYAIRLLLSPGSFNLCPADYCELPGIADGVSGRGLPIEAFDPPADVVDDAKRIVEAAGMDLGGVEYLADARTGTPTFYDVNALSNFVANAPETVGFDPFERLVDLIAERAGIATAARV
jgi:hypothetical protein